ncbi:SRPBCC family protein [Flavobacterium sp. GCM10027622]|uniref:SRPBCC family protein n=1 Tax=unclassified Flavobacterium TaxID=196869 RepID=UPI00361AB61A
MKILKKIFFTLLALIGIALIAGLIMDKNYAMERETIINVPKDSVFNYIKYLKNQDHFSVWNQKDPNSKRTFKGTDGEVGFIYTWDSSMDDVGAGDQEIKKIITGERIDMELRFKRPFESTDYAYFITAASSPSQTKVKWGFTGTIPYPMNIMKPFMNMDEIIGKDLETGLEQLKAILEQKK